MNELLIEMPETEVKTSSAIEHHCESGDHTQRLLGMRDANGKFRLSQCCSLKEKCGSWIYCV